MTLEIISPQEVVFRGETSSVTLPGELGSFTVLRNHASLISVLVKGDIVYKSSDGTDHSFPIKGGLADVDHNVVSVCIY